MRTCEDQPGAEQAGRVSLRCMSDVYCWRMRVMVRKQVYIEAGQEQFLKRRAGQLGVTEAELIRQGINLLSQAPTREPIDPAAWADEEAVLATRLRVKPARRGSWRFRRQEVYEERLGRVSR